jgi:hypothetical protein
MAILQTSSTFCAAGRGQIVGAAGIGADGEHRFFDTAGTLHLHIPSFQRKKSAMRK